MEKIKPPVFVVYFISIKGDDSFDLSEIKINERSNLLDGRFVKSILLNEPYGLKEEYLLLDEKDNIITRFPKEFIRAKSGLKEIGWV